VAKAKTKVSKKKKAAKKTPARKKAAKKTATKNVAKKKVGAKKAPSGKKSVTKKAAGGKIVKKKAVVKKTAAKKKLAPKKKIAKKAVEKKKPVVKKAPANKKKIVTKKSTAKKPTTKKKTAAAVKPKATPSAAKPGRKRKAPATVRTAPTPPPRPRIIRKIVNLEDVKIPLDYKPSEKEEYMRPQHLVYFKRKLESWRDELIVESEETLEHLRTETRDVGDEAERASRESDNILELRTRDRYRKLLRKIEEALKRIEEGAYGYCEETGEEIGLGRLEARPIATLTVDAQERREMFQKQFRDDR